MAAPVDILLVGLGSIGTVYSYLLERSGKARVTAIARSNYDLYTTTGPVFETDRFGTIRGYKPSRVFKTQAEALADGTKYAFCILCTKCLPDVLPNATLLADSIKSGQVGAYVLIQNGLGVEEDLAAATDSPIISCLAWISVVTNPTGDVVTWRGVWKGMEKLGCGIYRADNGPASDREQQALKLWVDLLQAGEGNVVVTDNIRSLRYSKNVWTATQASVQGLTRTIQTCFRPLGEQHHAQIKKFYREVVDVGFKTGLLYEGMVLEPYEVKCASPEHVVEEDFDKFIVHGSPHKWSLLVDVEQGRPFEVEVILGSVVKLAQEHSIPVPLTEFAFTLLKGVQQAIIEAREAKSA